MLSSLSPSSLASSLSLYACNNIDPGESWLHPGPLGGEDSMWIFDSYFKGCVELWSRERGLERSSTVLAGPGIPL